MMQDRFELVRFTDAQAPVIDQVRRELAAGCKRSHWMWFVFPQLRGLGHSDMARFYAIDSLAEAQAYLRHPLLGPRLIECTELVNAVQGRPIGAIFGSPDELKFRSSMTLFASVSGAPPVFAAALEKYFDGVRDRLTTEGVGAG